MLLGLASAAKELGIDAVVMDDGWFGERNDDRRSLGDWDANPKKLPHGLKGLGERIHAAGLQFGIWVEPEMISVQSKLYAQHPDWAMAAPEGLHSEGRNQRILDLANPEVVRFVIEKMSEVFSQSGADYVKWDMNRIFSDVYSPCLPPQRQGETAHRYICGLYQIMAELTRRFPDILFEGCASGGNRFDLGILSYFPQIWASDNTDALSRAAIQEGYSYGYPQSCVGAHVSAVPTIRPCAKPLSKRGLMWRLSACWAMNAICAILSFPSKRPRINAKRPIYKKWREVLQFGQFYRVGTGNIHEWICVSRDRKNPFGMLLQELTRPNTQSQELQGGRDWNEEAAYHLYSISERVDIKQFGSLINTVSPFMSGRIHLCTMSSQRLSG